MLNDFVLGKTGVSGFGNDSAALTGQPIPATITLNLSLNSLTLQGKVN